MISRESSAVSDVVGTMLLLAVTALLVSVAVTQVNSVASGTTDVLPRIDLRATAAPSGSGAGTLLLTHAGGDLFDRGDLTLVIDAQGTLVARAALPGNGTWQMGETVAVPLGIPLAGGERLTIALVSTGRSQVVATATVDVPLAGLAPSVPGAFTVTLRDPTATVETVPNALFRIVAQVDHAAGRKAILTVVADLTSIRGSPSMPLYDDGTHGDAVAGDGEYATFLVVPPSVLPATAPYRLSVQAISIDGTRTTAADFLVHVNPIPGAAPPGPPELDSTAPFTPISGAPNAKVTLKGVNLSYLNSVSLIGAAGDAYGATWWLGSDSEAYFVAPISAPFDRDYRIAVTSPTGSATTNATFRLHSPPGSVIAPPGIGAFSPSAGAPGAEINVTGSNLTFTTSVTLSGSGRTHNAVFWTLGTNGTELHFLVPPGISAGAYNVTVANPSGQATGATPFAVTSAAPLVFTDFTPKTGAPYTTFSVSGSGLSNVVVVNVGSVGVTFWVVNDSELRFLTHEGVVPGNATVKLFNQTGSSQLCCMLALPAPSPPEASTYPSSLFEKVGHNTTKSVGGGTGDHIISSLKFAVANDTFVVGADIYSLQSITLVYQPFKPGDVGRVPMTPICQPPPGPGGRLGVWLVRADLDIPNYVKDKDSYRYFFEMKWTNGRTGSNYRETVFYVDSSDTIQYFNLKQRETTKVIQDANQWPSEFNTCNL